jgi:large subunit ribosomal protein L29
MERPQLVKEITNMKEELMKVRFQAASAQLQNSAQLKTIRRKIAQAITVLNANQ